MISRMSVTAFDSLVEAFAERLHPRGWHGRFTVGDRVRVSLPRGESIVGRVLRPSEQHPDSHVVIAPEHGGPHVVAKVADVKLDTPADHAREREREQARQYAQAGLAQGQRVAGRAPVMAAAARAQATRAEILAKSPGAARELAAHQAVSSGARQRGLDQVEAERRAGRRQARPRVREEAEMDRPDVLGSLLEGAELSERFVSQGKREELGKKGHALHVDGKDIFPIENAKDAKNAVTLWLSGHHKTPEAKAHIIRNARRVGADDQVKRIQGSGD